MSCRKVYPEPFCVLMPGHERMTSQSRESLIPASWSGRGMTPKGSPSFRPEIRDLPSARRTRQGPQATTQTSWACELSAGDVPRGV